MLKVRTFITTGDELNLMQACNKFNSSLLIGGPPDDHDYTTDGFERPPDIHAGYKKGGRYDWMVVYIMVSELSKIAGIRAHFLHQISH